MNINKAFGTLFFFFTVVICQGQPVQSRIKKPQGELENRIQMAFDRLNGSEYIPVFTESFILADVNIQPNNPRRFYNFSGDLSGRYIEVMSVSNAKDLHINLTELVHKVISYQRPDGRFGNADLKFTEDQIGSQHMALLWGNGRLLVGLLAYYKNHRDDQQVLMAAKKLGDFFLTTYAACSSPGISKKLEGMGATGIICFTQYIEGLVTLSELTGDKKYAEVAAKVYQVLPERGKQHTHGYLTTLRGVLSLYQYDHNPAHLAFVEKAMTSLLNSDDYTAFGSVLEYFGKKSVNRDEGCATADFVRLCFDLYQTTKNKLYLEHGEHALLNALFFNQYYTGDFGHHIINDFGSSPDYEHTAWWCCTMHGLRALYDVYQHDVLISGAKESTLNLYLEGDYKTEHASISVTRGRFVNDQHHFILAVKSSEKPLLLRIPNWASSYVISVNGNIVKPKLNDDYAVMENLHKGDHIDIAFVYQEVIKNASGITKLPDVKDDVVKGVLQYGPYIMGVDDRIDHTFTAEPNDNLIYAQTVKTSIGKPSSKLNIRSIYDKEDYLTANYKHGGFPSNLKTIIRPISELTKDHHGYLMFNLSFAIKDVSDKNKRSMLEPWKAVNTADSLKIKKEQLMKLKEAFQTEPNLPWIDLGQGVKRQIYGHDEHLMLVKVKFETGAIGAVHEHFNSQISYVESGIFEVTIGNEKKTLKAGEGYTVPPNVKHGCVCLAAGVLIDAFSPAREDFLKTN